MFGAASLTLFVLLLIVAVLAHQAPLFLLALALLLAAGLSRLWERHCLTGLEYRRHLSRRRAQFGETVDLEVEIVNRKLLPLAWLEVEDEVPEALPPARGRISPSHKPTRALLLSLIARRPLERVRRRYPIHCTKRGEHIFGPVMLRTGDLFGLVSREAVVEQTESLVVYPRVVPLTALGLPAHQPLGDLRTRSWLFEDPSRLAGVREQRPEDSLRRIHWPASVRTQRLQVKVYEPTTSQKLAIFLDVQSLPGPWWNLGGDPEVLEFTITTAASIAAWGLDHGYQIGLTTNGFHRSSAARGPTGVGPAGGPGQLSKVLETLGRLQPFAARPFEATLAEGGRRLGFGVTVVAVSAVLAAPVASALIGLRRRGHPVVLVMTGRDSAKASLDGIAVRRVGPPEAWRTLPALGGGIARWGATAHAESSDSPGRGG